MKSILSSLLLYFIIISFWGCDVGRSQTPNTVEVVSNQKLSRRDLFRSMRDKGSLLLVHSSKDPQIAKQYQQIGDSLSNSGGRRQLDITIKADTDVTDSDLENEVLFVLGAHSTNQVLSQLGQSDLPFTFSENQFEFNGTSYPNVGQVFKLFIYPNPRNPKLPIIVYSGNDDQAIIDMIYAQHQGNWARAFWSSWGYEIFEENKRKVLGYFNDTTWTIGNELHFDFTEDSDSIIRSPHFRFSIPESVREYINVPDLVRVCELNCVRMLQFLGQTDSIAPINYRFYPSVEEKALQLFDMDQASVDFKSNTVHVVANNYFQGYRQFKDNVLWARSILGKPKKRALEDGLSIHFSEGWHQDGYQYWVQRLFQSNNLPPIKELVQNDLYAKESELVFPAAAAGLVDFLIEYWGKETFLQQYEKWDPNPKEIALLERKWRASLKEKSTAFPQPEKRKSKLNYYKGFNFAHEGYRIYNGYGSNMAKASLGKLKSINANSIAVVPYSYMGDPNTPTYLSLEQSAGGENDEATMLSHFACEELGMKTMMKPQIWLGRSWPGDVMMQTDEEWQQFFDYYYRWIRHYAMLAEIGDMDALSIGVEFAKATIAREDDWRKIIRKMRGLFSGEITYCANWGDEFEQVGFWDELDFIGLNCYYPLSQSDNPTKEELTNAFEEVIQKIERVTEKYNKQLVFTEIGFRSVEGPWKNPHEDALNRSYNAEHQRLCYEVVFEGVQDKPWCRGFFWWKWPSYLDYQGKENTSFTPNRKKAEETVKNWFNKIGR